MTDVRGQMTEDRCQRSEGRSQRTEDRCQKKEVGSKLKSEVGMRNAEKKTEYGIWKSECGSGKKGRRAEDRSGKSDPSSSQTNRTMPRQACGRRKTEDRVSGVRFQGQGMEDRGKKWEVGMRNWEKRAKSIGHRAEIEGCGFRCQGVEAGG
jgi:hypothetical protein